MTLTTPSPWTAVQPCVGVLGSPALPALPTLPTLSPVAAGVAPGDALVFSNLLQAAQSPSSDDDRED